jgi:hypothetical protein
MGGVYMIKNDRNEIVIYSRENYIEKTFLLVKLKI